MQEVCEVEPCRDTMPNASQQIITGYKAGCGHWSSVAVQVIWEPEICHGARVTLRAAARIQMQWPLQICLDAGAKQKV